MQYNEKTIVLLSVVGSNDPLSRFPQGGKALFGSPSPLGEGWDGGPHLSNIYDFY